MTVGHFPLQSGPLVYHHRPITIEEHVVRPIPLRNTLLGLYQPLAVVCPSDSCYITRLERGRTYARMLISVRCFSLLSIHVSILSLILFFTAPPPGGGGVDTPCIRACIVSLRPMPVDINGIQPKVYLLARTTLILPLSILIHTQGPTLHVSSYPRTNYFKIKKSSLSVKYTVSRPEEKHFAID